MWFKSGTAAVFAVVVAAGTVAVPAAAAPTTPAGGTIEIWATPGNGPVGPIVITGAIGDYGTATTIDKNGKVDNNGDYVKIALKHGGFEINSVALNQKTNNAPPTMVNNTTCSVEFGGSGLSPSSTAPACTQALRARSTSPSPLPVLAAGTRLAQRRASAL